MASESVGTSPRVAYDNPELQQRLLLATNEVFNLNPPLASYDGLRDGLRLAELLHELYPSFRVGKLERPEGPTWRATSERNIKTMYRGLFELIRLHVPELKTQATKFDLPAIAETPDGKGLSQILAIVLSICCLHPNKGRRYLERITRLAPEYQSDIMRIVKTMQSEGRNKNSDEVNKAVDRIVNVDLALEEENQKLRHRHEYDQKMLSDYVTRLDHLQQSYEELKYVKEQTDKDFETVRKATEEGSHSNAIVKVLEDRINEQLEIITRSEEEIRVLTRSRSQLQSEVEKLAHKSQQAEELRDEAADWRHKAEEHERRANTADRYKQKLEAQQHLERDYKNLQYEKAELQEELNNSREDTERCDRLKRAEEELTRMLTQSEQHLWDERNQKQQLSRDVATADDEIMRLKARQTHDENLIVELQDQLQQGSRNPTFESLDPVLGSNLEDELNIANEEEGIPNVRLRLIRIEAENDVLRKTIGASGEGGSLRRDRDDLKRRLDRLQLNYNEVFEKYVLSQVQVEAFSNGDTSEESEPFKKLGESFLQKQEGLEAAQQQLQDLRRQLSDSGREVIQVRGELAAGNKDGSEALDELRNADQLISKSLQAELDRLREEYGILKNEQDAQKSQLVHALVEKDKLRRSAEDNKGLQEVAVSATESEVLRNREEKIGKLKARLTERVEQLEKSEEMRLELQRRIKAFEGGEAARAQKAATDQIIQNLKRENSLITSAWVDLTNRIQSNHVVLQRRQDAPKSWLNKQRQMVNATSKR